MQRITTAPVGQRQHQQQQIGRYLFSMGIRTGCFILAIFAATSGVTWLMWLAWVFVVAAVVLPYVAVLVANAGRETVGPTTTQVTPPAQAALTAAAARPVQEPLVGQVFTGPVDERGEDAGTARQTGAPREWDAERLRPPAGATPAAGGSRRHAA